MAPILRKNRLRELMKKGTPTVGTHIHSSWPGIVEVIGNSGMADYVEFTRVYAPFDLYALDNLARTSELYDMSMMIKIDPEFQITSTIPGQELWMCVPTVGVPFFINSRSLFFLKIGAMSESG